VLKIPDVTLLMLSDVDISDSVYAVNKSCEEIEWGAVKFLGSKGKPEGLCDQAIYESTYPIQSINDFNFYCIYNLGNHVETSHVLLIHADGYVIRPWLWDNTWTQYDYIGAPWRDDPTAYLDPWGKNQRVGNGGFSLRSKKLLDVPKNVVIPWEVNDGNFYRHMNAGLYNEDGNICVHNRHIFEAHGCKFAPVKVASKFSREQTLPDSEEETFGFHYHFQEIK
jgi:hypothetical protein